MRKALYGLSYHRYRSRVPPRRIFSGASGGQLHIRLQITPGRTFQTTFQTVWTASDDFQQHATDYPWLPNDGSIRTIAAAQTRKRPPALGSTCAQHSRSRCYGAIKTRLSSHSSNSVGISLIDYNPIHQCFGRACFVLSSDLIPTSSRPFMV
jgi:hypothetical protein